MRDLPVQTVFGWPVVGIFILFLVAVARQCKSITWSLISLLIIVAVVLAYTVLTQ
jgi:hypothetical protein